MRPAALFAALVFSAAPAMAQPVADVTVRIGPDLREKADEYGAREVERLALELEADVERSLAREGRLAPEGGRLDLVLSDAVPNRPTFEQLGRRPGLSFESYGVGGATIEGEYVAADGTRTPLRYRWYESDIRDAQGATTWTDADRAFDRFARRVARGDLPVDRSAGQD